MFSDYHRPRQERHTISKNNQLNHATKKLRQRLCFGLVLAFFICCICASVLLNPSTLEYDSSALIFWMENSTGTFGASQRSTNNPDDNHLIDDFSSSFRIIKADNNNGSSATNAQIELLRPTGRMVYSYVRGDRSGAAIQDMLMAHAFAFSRGQRYGGACQRREFKDYVIQPRRDLLRILGLESEMPFQCSSTGKLMNRAKYTQQDTGIFTPKYLKYMHAVMMMEKQQQQQQS
ncbi:unnamed protein product [Cylindrotheca closterium]|uniref:Uncharacterized protein n=1 Tax=Cylindrotheca closterium TaxID=2856 RepID=A0AAD2FM11_9STRA|nr:unnamed protein product [Cylindrotheca closterium]CAJ1944166.1 unnamed protein product [Cylindrotheca closterium]